MADVPAAELPPVRKCGEMNDPGSSFPASRSHTNHPNLATRDQRPCSACIAVPSSEVPLASTADIQLPVRRMGTGGERHEFGGKLVPFKVGCQVSKPSRTSYIQYNTLRVSRARDRPFHVVSLYLAAVECSTYVTRHTEHDDKCYAGTVPGTCYVDVLSRLVVLLWLWCASTVRGMGRHTAGIRDVDYNSPWL